MALQWKRTSATVAYEAVVFDDDDDDDGAPPPAQQQQPVRVDPRRVVASPASSSDGVPAARQRTVIPLNGNDGGGAGSRVVVPLGSARAAPTASPPPTSASASASASSASSPTTTAGGSTGAPAGAGGRMVFALASANANASNNKRHSLVLAPVSRDAARALDDSPSSPPPSSSSVAHGDASPTSPPTSPTSPTSSAATEVTTSPATQQEPHLEAHHQPPPQQPPPQIVTTPSTDDVDIARSPPPVATHATEPTTPTDAFALSAVRDLSPPSVAEPSTTSPTSSNDTASLDPPSPSRVLTSASEPSLPQQSSSSAAPPPTATTTATTTTSVSPSPPLTASSPSPPPAAAAASGASRPAAMGRTLSFTPRSGGARASMTILLSDTGELQVHQELLNDDQEVTASSTHSLSTSSNTPSWVNSSVDTQAKRPAVKQSLLSRSPLLFADQKASGKFSLVKSAAVEDSPKRKEVIKELIDTERNYVNDLGIIINVFLTPIRRDNILNKAEIGALFSNVEALLPVNTGILQDLENPAMSIGTIFQERGDMLKLYAVYCSNQPNIRNLVEAYKNEKEEFGAFLQKAFRRKECRKLDMESFLILPLQRLCKYPLLLKEVLKFTPESHPDHQAMTEAYDKIKKIVDIVNERVRKVENVIKVAGVESRLVNKADFDLADYNRQFVKEGTIRIDNHDMYAFLFSDALLICRYPKKGPEDKFVGKRLIPLNMAVLKDIEDTEDRKHSFELAEIGNRIYTLTVANGIEKKSWFKHLTGIITELGGSSEAKEQSVTILRRMTIDRQAKSAPLRVRAAAASSSSSEAASSSSSSPSSLSPLSLLTPRGGGGSGSSEASRAAVAALEAKVEDLTKALEVERGLRRQLEAYTKSMSEMFRQMSAETKAEKLEEERKRLEEEEALRRKASANEAATLMQMVEKLTAENLELRAKLKETRAQLKTRE